MKYVRDDESVASGNRQVRPTLLVQREYKLRLKLLCRLILGREVRALQSS